MEILDKRERELISKDLKHTYMVEAGAGTGKTTLLVERILNLLLSKKAELRDIVAITFTEKAAAELKQRLDKEISKTLLCPGRTNESIDVLMRAREDIPKAAVGTIHSFASSVLREMAVESGLDPFFTVQDELGKYLFFNRVWEEWIGKVANGKTEQKDILKYLLRCEVDLNSLEMLSQKMLYSRGSVSVNTEFTEPFFEPFLEKVQSLFNLVKKECVNPADKAFTGLKDLLARLEEIRNEDSLAQQVALKKFKKISTRLGAKKNYSSGKVLEKIKAEFSVLSMELEEFVSNFQDLIAFKAVSFLEPFCTHFDEEKEKAALVDFDDLLINTAKLLRENIEVRNFLKKRYKYVFIDEFQDVDQLQMEIVFFLSEENTDSPAREWKDIILVEGKLFIVGDPKQSIYRFRKADMEMYFDVCQKIEKEGKLLNITQNFRSKEAIIEWANTFFNSAMVQDSRYQAQYIPLSPKEKENQPCVIHIRPDDEEYLLKENIEKKRKAEAKGIALFIKGMLDEKKITPKDCAVLFRTLSQTEIYLDAFRKEGVPCHIIGGKTYFKTSEISYLISLLTVLDSPFESIHLIASLKSPFFNISDEEIFLFKEDVGSIDFLFSTSKALPENLAGILKAFEVLRLLYKKKFSLSLPEFIEAIFEDTGIFFTHACKPGGFQRVANLKKIVEYSWAFQNISSPIGNITLKQFITWLSSMAEGGIEVEEPLLQEFDNAVSFLSIHKSKGLEYPLVVLADIFSSKRSKSETILSNGEKKIEVNICGNKTLGWADADEEEKKKADAEEIRILYVGATRAKDYLVLPMYFGKGNKKNFDLFLNVYPENENGCPDTSKNKETNNILKYTSSREISTGTKTEKKAFFKQEYLADESNKYLSVRDDWVKKREEVKKLASMPIKRITPSKLSGTAQVKTFTEEARGGKEIGLAVHSVLEAIDLSDTRNLMELCKVEAEKNEEDADYIFNLISKNLKTPFFTRIKESKKILKEVSFGINLDENITHGQVDILFRSDGHWVLGEYKTDNVENVKEAGERYVSQLQAYINCLFKIFPYNVGEVVIHFLVPAESVSVPIIKPCSIAVINQKFT